MSYPPIPAIPQAPQRGDTPTNYADIADAFTASLPGFQIGANSLAAWMQSTASDVQSYATTAINAPGTSATSTTSLTIAAGSQSLTIQTGKSIVVGMSVIIASTASPTNRMIGIVTAYTTGTGALVVSVVTIEGAGTFAAWTVSLSGAGAMNPVTAAQLALKAPLDNPTFSTGLTCMGRISTINEALKAGGYAGVGTDGLVILGDGTSYIYKYGANFFFQLAGIGAAVIDKAGTVAMLGDIAVANSPSVMTALNASGAAPIYAVRAWATVNMRGTAAIVSAGNMSSLIDNGTGDFTLSFTAAMPDALYAISGMAVAYSSTDSGDQVALHGSCSGGPTLKSTTQVRIKHSNNVDFSLISIMVVR